MGVVRSGWEEIKRVFKMLDKKTKRVLIGMALFTVIISTLMFKVFENPVLEAWRENKETEQILEKRKVRLKEEEGRKEERKEEIEEIDGNKEPTF